MRIASYKEASGLMEDHHYLEQITGMYVSTHPGLNFFRQIFKFSLSTERQVAVSFDIHCLLE